MSRTSLSRITMGLALVAGLAAFAPAPQGQQAGENGESLLPTLRTIPVPRSVALPNVTVVNSEPLPRDRAAQLDYEDQSGNFTIGQALQGQASGATGNILADADRGFGGTLTLTGVDGEFEAGETITDALQGSATVAKPLREGVWVLDFAYKPLRMRKIQRGGQTRDVLYLYYRVANRTGQSRMFVPQFFLETDGEKRYPDVVLPEAIRLIQAREGAEIPLLGAVANTGMIPASEKPNVDDAVFGAAVWIVDDEIAGSDELTVYVRGLSDGVRVVPPEEGEDGEGTKQYKTLKIPFARPGDEFNFNENEIRASDPPNEWVYD